MVAILTTRGKNLSEIVDQLPVRHIIKDKIKTTEGIQIIESLKKIYSHEQTDQTDGLKIFRGDSWGLVRASGTEPIIRIIVDADNEKNRDLLYEEIKAHVLRNE